MNELVNLEVLNNEPVVWDFDNSRITHESKEEESFER